MRSSDASLRHLDPMVSIPHFDVFLQISQTRVCSLMQPERTSRRTKVSSQLPSSDEVRDMVGKRPWLKPSQVLAVLAAPFVSSDFPM